MTSNQLLKVIPIAEIADIAYDYFNETKNNYRLVMKQYHSLFYWTEHPTALNPGNNLTRIILEDSDFFFYNHRDLLFKHYNELQWKHKLELDPKFKNIKFGISTATDIFNLKTGYVKILPRSYYYTF